MFDRGEVTVTVTPGNAEPSSATTRPFRVPVGVCARTDVAASAMTPRLTRRFLIVRIEDLNQRIELRPVARPLSGDPIRVLAGAAPSGYADAGYHPGTRMTQGPAHPTLDPLTRQVIAALAEVRNVPAETIQPDSSFEELGVDSLDGINLAFALEEQFDIEIPDEAVQSVGSVRDVVDRLRPLVGSGD